MKKKEIIYESNQNVHCIDLYGNFKWEIERLSKRGYFINIYFGGDELWVYDPVGIACHIDKETGKILKLRYQKF